MNNNHQVHVHLLSNGVQEIADQGGAGGGGGGGGQPPDVEDLEVSVTIFLFGLVKRNIIKEC